MAEKTKISIITPSFNSIAFIEQTIDSVLSQAHLNVEYIIIDGGSTDGTVDIIKRYQKHLSYWVSESDNGQSHAINKGLIQAKGDVINWLNADDYYEKDSLSKIADVFQNPNVNCFCGRSNIVDESGNKIRQTSGTDIYTQNLSKTLGLARIDQPETFFRKEVFEKLGGVNENLHFVMDKEFWMRYLLSFGLEGVAQSDKVLVNFRHHPNSKTGSSSNRFHEETALLFWSLAMKAGLYLDATFIKQMQKLDLDGNPELTWPVVEKELVTKVLQYFYLYLADYSYYQGRKKESALYLDAIRENNLDFKDLSICKKLKFRNRFVPVFVQKLKQQWL